MLLDEAARALHFEDHNDCDEGELRQQAHLLRCIFGNPFRPVALDPAWLTPNVVDLARAIYDARAFDRMSLLVMPSKLPIARTRTSSLIAEWRPSIFEVAGSSMQSSASCEGEKGPNKRLGSIDGNSR